VTYCRFSKNLLTKVVDYRIDAIEKSISIETTDTILKNKIFFVGGPATCLDKINLIIEKGSSFINIDKGYFRNRKSNSHWRMTFNNFQQTKIFDVPADRLENNFDIKLKNWKKNGSYILILAPNPKPLNFYFNTEDTFSWALDIKNKLLNFTDRKVFIRFKNATTKGNDPLIKYLDDCYAVVTLQSLGGVQSIIEGIPVISLADCCMKSICKNELKDIENLTYPDNRYDWLKSLAYGQFTEEELINGSAMSILKELYAW
jgi:hypothetical protein